MFSRVEIHARNKVNVIANVSFLVSLGIKGLEGTGIILTETQGPTVPQFHNQFVRCSNLI